MSSKPFKLTDGHVFIPAKDLAKALKFYRDILGISIKRSMSDWIDLTPSLALSLTREEDEELIEFHVEDFEEAEEKLESEGINVERKSKHSGRIIDPFGNVIGLHDHKPRS